MLECQSLKILKSWIIFDLNALSTAATRSTVRQKLKLSGQADHVAGLGRLRAGALDAIAVVCWQGLALRHGNTLGQGN